MAGWKVAVRAPEEPRTARPEGERVVSRTCQARPAAGSCPAEQNPAPLGLSFPVERKFASFLDENEHVYV